MRTLNHVLSVLFLTLVVTVVFAWMTVFPTIGVLHVTGWLR